jgi:hypothetical protein
MVNVPCFSIFSYVNIYYAIFLSSDARSLKISNRIHWIQCSVLSEF